MSVNYLFLSFYLFLSLLYTPTAVAVLEDEVEISEAHRGLVQQWNRNGYMVKGVFLDSKEPHNSIIDIWREKEDPEEQTAFTNVFITESGTSLYTDHIDFEYTSEMRDIDLKPIRGSWVDAIATPVEPIDIIKDPEAYLRALQFLTKAGEFSRVNDVPLPLLLAPSDARKYRGFLLWGVYGSLIEKKEVIGLVSAIVKKNKDTNVSFVEVAYHSSSMGAGGAPDLTRVISHFKNSPQGYGYIEVFSSFPEHYTLRNPGLEMEPQEVNWSVTVPVSPQQPRNNQADWRVYVDFIEKSPMTEFQEERERLFELLDRAGRPNEYFRFADKKERGGCTIF